MTGMSHQESIGNQIKFSPVVSFSHSRTVNQHTVPIATKRFDCLPLKLCPRWLVAFCVPALPMSWQLSVQHLGCMLASETKSDVQVWWPRERILSDEGVRSRTQNHLRPRSGVKIPCFDEFWWVLQFRKGKVILLMDSVNGVPDGALVMFPVYTHVPYRIHFCCLKGESQIDQHCFPFFWQINAMTSTVKWDTNSISTAIWEPSKSDR